MAMPFDPKLTLPLIEKAEDPGKKPKALIGIKDLGC
jgi:hypothetical protein